MPETICASYWVNALKFGKANQSLSQTIRSQSQTYAIVEPDSAIYRLHHPYPENIFWVVEYSNSSLQKDLDIKTKVYAAANILEYWVINLKKMELIVFRDPIDGEYRSRVTFTQGDIRPLAFQDTVVSVSRLLT